MTKTKWTAAEINKMGCSSYSRLQNAMESGYFSRTIFKKNNIEVSNKFSYAYSGVAKAYIKVYYSQILYNLFQQKKLKF